MPLREEGRNKTKASSGKKRPIAAAGHLISQTDRLPDLAPSPRALRRGAACSPVGPQAPWEVAEASSGRVPPPLSMSAALYSLFLLILPQIENTSTRSSVFRSLPAGFQWESACRYLSSVLGLIVIYFTPRGEIHDRPLPASSTRGASTGSPPFRRQRDRGHPSRSSTGWGPRDRRHLPGNSRSGR